MRVIREHDDAEPFLRPGGALEGAFGRDLMSCLSDEIPSEPAGPAIASGTRIGPYEITGLAGKGGMGEVYRAHDVRLGRDVAIKILPPQFTSDPDRLARFEREARALAALNHPNIAAIYGLEEGPVSAAPLRSLVLEFVDGETLAERLTHRSGPRGLPMSEALGIARQIADALDAAHDKGIVHRDLKPSNVKITSDGVVKLLDFGIAKAALPERDGHLLDHATQAGIILGTVAYMSPEQARGRAVDKRSDIWSFGCVLYEMLTGCRAFAGETASDTIAAILEREPDWTKLPSTTPPALAGVLRRSLEKDPKQRLRDMGDARIEIDGAMDGRQHTGPAAPQFLHRRSRWVRVAAVVAALATAVMAGVLMAGVFWPAMVGTCDARAEDWPADPPHIRHGIHDASEHQRGRKARGIRVGSQR